MKIGKLKINPALSPGVLDTATWDRDAAWTAVQAVDDIYWPELVAATSATVPLPDDRKPDTLCGIGHLAG